MSAIDQLMAVMEAAFDPHWRESWTRAQVESSLTLPHTYALLVDTTGAPIADDTPAAGFILVRRAPGEEELLLIGVRPEARGRGVGTALLEAFFATARSHGAEEVFLEMRDNNPAASLYRTCGFAPIGRRKGYYRALDGTLLDAITFGRKV